MRPLLRLTIQVGNEVILGWFLSHWGSEEWDSPLLLFLMFRVFVMSSWVWGILQVACLGGGGVTCGDNCTVCGIL